MSSVITANFGYQPTTPTTSGASQAELDNRADKSVVTKAVPDSKVTEDQPAQDITAGELGDAVENINQFVNAQGRSLNFSVDEESGKPIVKVLDLDTKEVIRQIPSEEVLTMAKAIKRLQEDLGSATGLLIDKTI